MSQHIIAESIGAERSTDDDRTRSPANGVREAESIAIRQVLERWLWGPKNEAELSIGAGALGPTAPIDAARA